jgi:hypothetical protein
MRLNRGSDFRHLHPLYFEAVAIIGCLINFLLNLTVWLPPILIRTGDSKRVSFLHPVLETSPTFYDYCPLF